MQYRPQSVENYTAVTTRCGEPYARRPPRATDSEHSLYFRRSGRPPTSVKPLVTPRMFPSDPVHISRRAAHPGRVAARAPVAGHHDGPVPSHRPPGAAASAAVTRAYVALSAADTVLAGLGARRLRRLTKPLLMPTLARGLLAATSPSDGPSDPGTTGGPDRRARAVRATLAAQALSGGGDVALLGRGDVAFLTGLSSFLAGHGAYVLAFTELRRTRETSTASPGGTATWSRAVTSGDDRLGRVGPALAGTAYAIVGPTLSRAAARSSPRLRVPVLVYGGVLSVMVATASRVGPQVGPEARRRLVAGSALFLVSDGLLGTREFLGPADASRGTGSSWRRPALDVAVMTTYTAAQGLIADGVARAVVAEPSVQGTGTTRT